MEPKRTDKRTPLVWPKSYDEARAQFLSLAESVLARFPGSEFRSFNVPSAKDPNLFVDDLFIPSIASPVKLLVLTSGVHGLEASLGSAVQQQFLREFLPSIAERGIAVWIVHTLNPWGWKFGRRVTEENINLNRNFGISADTFRTENEGYLSLAPQFEREKKASAGTFHWLTTLAFLIKRVIQMGERKLSQAISQGQFTNPRGLEFGGTGPTPQAAYFRKRFEDLSAPFEEIVLIDLHTGLGKRGRLHLLTGFDEAKCVHRETFARLFRPHDEAGLYEYNSGHEKGFYQTVGDINTLVAECAPLKRVVALTFEFGTLGNSLLAKADSLSRLWLENQGFHHGFTSKNAGRFVRGKFRELFEPQDRAWQTNALETTRRVFKLLVERL